jgi:hypothetical protein
MAAQRARESWWCSIHSLAQNFNEDDVWCLLKPNTIDTVVFLAIVVWCSDREMQMDGKF